MRKSLTSDNKNLEIIDQSIIEINAINFSDITDYYRNGYVVFYNNNELSCCVVNTISIRYVEKNFSQLNTQKAQSYLSQISTICNAKTVDYKKMITGFVLLFTLSLLFFSNLFHVINNIIYLIQNILKALLFKRSIDKNLQKTCFLSKKDIITSDKVGTKNNRRSTNKDLYNLISIYYKGKMPIYTIFVPLYKEVRKLKFIIKAIDNLDYPKSKLDVKFIVEADDRETNKALSILKLPKYIHVIKVPTSLPRTKPKAMNYATAYVKGEFLCVYDAEDKPDSDQLLKALQAFKELPKEYACVQARLNFYNPNENILTKFFSIEYSLWFEYLLKGLNLYDLPITLGGTSNHFKVSILEKVGYWDAYNVTEDADLGIRLYSNGYKVHIIDSETLEESPIGLFNWLTQRTRWIKGFIQTIYIFLLSPKNYKELGPMKIITIYIFVGFSSYSFFCMPWLISLYLFKLDQYIYYLWIINTVFSLTYVYSSVYYIAKQKKFVVLNFFILLLWPLYFVLHTVAAYWAIVEIFITPFKWNKTKHGVSVNELD